MCVIALRFGGRTERASPLSKLNSLPMLMKRLRMRADGFDVGSKTILLPFAIPSGRRRRFRTSAPGRPRSGSGTVRLPPALRRHPDRAAVLPGPACRRARPWPLRSMSPALGRQERHGVRPGHPRRKPPSNPPPARPKARNAGKPLRWNPSARHLQRPFVRDPEHPLYGPSSAQSPCPSRSPRDIAHRIRNGRAEDAPPCAQPSFAFPP